MSLRISHIDTEESTEAELFAKNILAPKWEDMAKREAIKTFAKVGIRINEETMSPSTGPASTQGA